MEDRFRRLEEHIASMGRVVVCFSGGLDSTVLMHVCRLALGDDAIAIHVSVPMESGRTSSMVDRISSHLGFGVVRRHMGADDSGTVLMNLPDRCYSCKRSIYSHALDLARSVGAGHVLCGDNSDDDPGSRPGMRAGAEMGIGSPFRDLGISRRDVEGYVRSLELPFRIVKDTCLLTRIPVGVAADRDLLGTVERIESGIRDITGVEQLRARIRDGKVSVQTSDRELPGLLAHRGEIEGLCGKEGFGTEIVRTSYTG